jgi:hypothetical protein
VRARALASSEPVAAWTPAVAAWGARRHRLRSAAPRCVCDTLHARLRRN